jgi:hypothetical protein
MVVQRFGGSLPAERIARPPIERGGDGIDLFHRARSVPLGKCWRSRPLVFSFVPRRQAVPIPNFYAMAPTAAHSES